jgi:WbqC-like protein
VWLTVPVLHTSRFGQTIVQAEIDNRSDGARKHRESLRIHHRKAPHFDRYWPLFEDTFARRWERLVDLDLHFMDRLKDALGIEAATHRSSELGGGVRLDYQRYEHPTYRQLYGDFMPSLSVVDLLYNCGPESRTILAGGGGRKVAETHVS